MLVVKAKQEEVDKLLRQLSELRAQAEALEGKKASLAREIEACTLKIGRAERLIEGLGDEQQRWGKEAEVLSERKDNVIGDMLLCAGVVNYLGAFTKDFRDDALIEWEELMTSVGLNYSRPESGCFSIVPHLSDPVTVLTWHLEGLPNDPLSVENAIIVHEAVRAPLMVDPVGQATRWLTSMFKKGNLQTLKAQERDLMRKIENAVQFGLPVIIQEVAESLDAALDPVLSKQVFTQSGVTYVRMGDANIEWNDKFRLFLSCPLSNPHFLPDTAAKVTQINFAITEQGLGDQLLGIMLSEERPLVAEQHRELTLQRAANAKRLQDLEDQILRVVSTERKGTEEGAGGSILDDEAAISIVQESKRLSAEIVEKNKGIALAQEKLDEARDAFHGTGLYAAMLFFCVQDLHALDPMYLFSLDWFVSAFVSSIRSAPRSDDMAVRLEGIRSELLWNIFEAVCMGLFARDKLTFAAIIALKVIQRHEGSDTAPAATPEQIRYLLTGGQSVAKHPREAEPPRAGVSSAVWVRCCRLSAVLPRLEKLPDAIAEDPASWSAALEAMTEACSELPKGFLDGAAPLTVWERLLVVRALRPDLTVRATRVLVGDILGDRFAEPPPMDMQHVFAHSSATRPMLFLLAPGLDPIQSVWQYAERMGIKKRVVSVSLGQGQGAKAEKVLVPGARDGDWVVLQNAHLSPSWLPWLERFVRSLQVTN